MTALDLREQEAEIRRLLDAIYSRYHYDFRDYAMASLRRRITLALVQLRYSTIEELRSAVLSDERVFAEFLQLATVQVSDMFRDPDFFRAFRERVIPELSTYPSIRLWVAGCSAGEEVYSYAIILKEEGLLDRSIIYATDINPEALAKAESGVYPLSSLPTFSQNYLEARGKGSLAQYYRADYDAAIFDRSLRANIVFSDHSLATDSVFAEVQVISCRNVLIYFDRQLRERALKLFRESLCRRGFLGLGPRETLQFSEQHENFSAFDVKRRWFQRC